MKTITSMILTTLTKISWTYQTWTSYRFKAIKQISKEVKELKDRKSDKLMYRLPIQICNYSLF